MNIKAMMVTIYLYPWSCSVCLSQKPQLRVNALQESSGWPIGKMCPKTYPLMTPESPAKSKGTKSQYIHMRFSFSRPLIWSRSSKRSIRAMLTSTTLRNVYLSRIFTFFPCMTKIYKTFIQNLQIQNLYNIHVQVLQNERSSDS